MDPHKVIRKHMRAITRDDNLPISVGHGTREKLTQVWGELGYQQVVEIGVQQALFSVVLLGNNPHCHLHLVDPWHEFPYGHQTEEKQEWYLDQAKTRLKQFNGRYTLHRMTSHEALPLFMDGSLDAVYIDGDHTFDHAVTDIIFWSKKVRPGGMVAVHDYCHMRRSGVMKAVDAYTHCHSINPWYVTREVLPTAFWVKT